MANNYSLETHPGMCQDNQ